MSICAGPVTLLTGLVCGLFLTSQCSPNTTNLCHLVSCTLASQCLHPMLVSDMLGKSSVGGDQCGVESSRWRVQLVGGVERLAKKGRGAQQVGGGSSWWVGWRAAGGGAQLVGGVERLAKEGRGAQQMGGGGGGPASSRGPQTAETSVLLSVG